MAKQSDAPKTSGSDTPERAARTSLVERLSKIETSLSILADAERAKVEQRPRRLARNVSLFENWWGVRLFLSVGSIVALVAFGLSLWAYNEERTIRAEEREARQQESLFRRQTQIATAWSTLLTPVGGNTGKGEALQLLLSDDPRLIGVDLSCRNVGQWVSGTCTNPAIFDFSRSSGLGSTGLYMVLENVDFEGNTILDLYLNRAVLEDVNLTGVTAQWWTLESVNNVRYQQFQDLACTDCTFIGMHFDWRDILQFRNADFGRSSVIFPMDAQLGSEQDPAATTSDGQLRLGISPDPDRRIWKERLYLDNPPLFLRAGVPTGEADEAELLTTPAIESLYWELYDQLNICIRLETILDENLPSPHIERPDMFKNSRTEWVSREELAEQTAEHSDICGYSLQSPPVREAFLNALRREFSGAVFPWYSDSRYLEMIHFECAGDKAVLQDPAQEETGPLRDCSSPWIIVEDSQTRSLIRSRP